MVVSNAQNRTNERPPLAAFCSDRVEHWPLFRSRTTAPASLIASPVPSPGEQRQARAAIDRDVHQPFEDFAESGSDRTLQGIRLAQLPPRLPVGPRRRFHAQGYVRVRYQESGRHLTFVDPLHALWPSGAYPKEPFSEIT